MSKSNHFFALLHRMKYIFRWGLMRSSRPENVCEHTCDVAMLAHALAVIGRDVFGKDVDPAAIATAALFHDASEIITGDLPTPVKYINKQLSGAYKAVEQTAKERLLQTLPEELVESYRPLLFLEEENPHPVSLCQSRGQAFGVFKMPGRAQKRQCRVCQGRNRAFGCGRPAFCRAARSGLF
jgi:5'-deoxynucleotidase YfbR-like HD superfamily hydrolase